jgi:serine/threonine protein kinase/tetratricopeptide (TPR) repeat protein
MAISMASVVATCSVCGESLNSKGACLACLIRAALDKPGAKAAAPVSLIFGDFEVARREDGSLWELGRGAMGVTYLALDKVLRRKVALKARSSQAVRERFLREARSAAALRHPNVAAVFQFGASPDGRRRYYAMELVEGETLETRVRRDGPLNPELALEIAIQVSRALAAAAARRLIHRDLKPGNIMLTNADETADVDPSTASTATQRRGYYVAHTVAASLRRDADRKHEKLVVKIIDFGLAKAIADAESEMDLTHGEFVGTPNFASPEQFGSGPIDARSDIYSLGATLWFALTGKPPFGGGRTIEEIRRAQQSAALPIEQLKATRVPTRFKSLLKSMLAIEPAARPSVHELVAWLRRCSAQASGVRRTSVALTAAAIVILGTAAFFVFRSVQTGNTPVATASNLAQPEKSIAVLPFENLSKDEENAFFAGGVQDEILTDLAKVADLKVISRTSVMKYKSGLERNLRDISKVLGVSHVVEGSVQRTGGRVRVNVQLINARNDTHLWAEHYDRDFADIFAVQSDIAQQIANQLQAKLSPAESAAIAERPTTDLVAYTYYTRANQINIYTDNWEGAEKNGNQKAELLEKAVQHDPNFVLAYCELAKTYLNLGDDEAEQHKHVELAKNAAETAVRLRPDLPEPHLALARYYWLTPDSVIGVDREAAYDRARDELAIVRRMSPNNAEALLIDATIGRHQNRWDASLANLQMASELDPRNREVAYRLEQIYFELRRYSEFEQLIRKQAASGGYPLEDPFIQTWLAQMKLAQGDPVAAQSFLEQVPIEYSVWDTRFMAALYLRDYDAANRVIAATPAKYADAWADGQIARARGDHQKALAAFAAARGKVDATWSDKPKNVDYFTQVSILDAGLGRKEEAIREAQRAVELVPIAKDAVNGPDFIKNLARVYAWTGERDRALEQLEKIATIPGSLGMLTYGDLRFNPCWDDLRGDKRFDKIVAAAKAASK